MYILLEEKKFDRPHLTLQELVNPYHQESSPLQVVILLKHSPEYIKILTFDVSNVIRYYDIIFWQLRNRESMAWDKS